MRYGCLVLTLIAACGSPPPATDGEGDPDSPGPGAAATPSDGDGGTVSGLTGLGGGGSDGGSASGTNVSAMLDRAKLAVGYSYYWGHGSWRADHQTLGACMGTCPSCTHNSGTYGADCSGFVAKVWQVPSASALETDQHPYSTYNFYNQTTHWKPVPRSTLQPGDALVRRDATTGHIALVESVDASGQIWVYEARGCSTGVVHDLRAFDTSYIAIRRDPL